MSTRTRAKPPVERKRSTSRVAEGFRDYQLKLISAAQDNVNALFEYAHNLVQAQSFSELVELSNSHSRRQLEMMAEQTRELASSAQRMAADAAKPLTGVFGGERSQMS
jgi:hypothetical protein